jgi:hypothetical protein
MRPGQQLVAGARGVHAQQDLDGLDVLAGDLPQGVLGDRDLVDGGVGAGVARAQQSAHRLTGLVAVGQHRVKAVAAFEVARRALLVGVRGQQRGVQIDRCQRRRPGELPHPGASPGVCAIQRVEHPRCAGDLVDHPKRRGVRGDRPEQRRLVADRAQVGQAVAAVGEHHRQITDHPARVMTGAALAQPGQLLGQLLGQPRAVGHPSQQAAARMRDQTGSVRRHFYLHQAPIAHHLQGEPPESDFRPSTSRRIPAQADSSAAPVPGAADA